MKLLLACFLFCVIGAEVAFGQNLIPLGQEDKQYFSVVASLRDVPTIFHKCDATFVRRDVLITTARCAICAQKCNFYIRVFDPHLIRKSVFRVKEVIIHPKYEQLAFGMYNNDQYDIALIKLEESIKFAAVFFLPDKIPLPPVFDAEMFRWSFYNHMNDFYMLPHSVKKISNEMCSSLINSNVPDNEICVYSNFSFSLGPFDQGSPLLAEFNRKKYILGIYKDHNVYDTHIAKFMSIAPFVNWIKSQIHNKHNTDPSEFHPFQPDIPQPDQFQTQQFHSDPYKSFHM